MCGRDPGPGSGVQGCLDLHAEEGAEGKHQGAWKLEDLGAGLLRTFLLAVFYHPGNLPSCSLESSKKENNSSGKRNREYQWSQIAMGNLCVAGGYGCREAKW